MRITPALILACFFSGLISGTAQPDTTMLHAKEKVKKGWTFGALPVVAYDADKGLQLGALGQVFNYGDGSTYPEYKHTFYGEVSFFTKGSSVFQVFYDSKYLIPKNIRVTAEVTYLTERALDFYGFNGYESTYDHAYESQGSDQYISRVYYRHDLKMFRVTADFQGPILDQKFRWLAGINFFDIQTGTVDISKINKGRKEEKKLPDTALLYDQYVKYGLISEEERYGGTLTILKLGLIYDTRDNEAAPNRGIWTEALLMTSPKFAGSHSCTFLKLTVTHRQYISLVKKYLVFAYRLGYQGTIAGTAPFYIEPYMFSSWSATTLPDGLGGSRSLRGILRNRVVGSGFVMGNLELRWKFWRTKLFRQNLYLGLVGFIDGGMVVQDRKVSRDLVPEDQQYLFFDQSKDRLHLSCGGGLRIALNENFIVTCDYGFPFDHRDGNSGLYIALGHRF